MSEAGRSGKTPYQMVAIEYDQCRKMYGQTGLPEGNCSAVLGVSSERKCFNTVKTCAVPADFVLRADGTSWTPTYIKFGTNMVDSLSDQYVIPSLLNVSVSPAKLNPAGGGSLSSLGQRSTITVSLTDHRHTDFGLDPYVSERLTGAAQSSGVGYNPYDLGTFWGKWLGRQEYFVNRRIIYTSGYIRDGQLVETKTQTFYITALSGPSSDGTVQIEGIDPLGMLSNEKAQAPLRSRGSLLAAINSTDLSATLTPVGVGNAHYPASGEMRVDNEVIAFTRSGDVLTLTRGQRFTVGAAHDAGALAQTCLVYSAASVSDILYSLLTTYGGIATALIDKPAWDAEIAAHNSRLYSAVITEPVGVAALVSELTEQAGVYVWYDGPNNTIRLRCVRQADTDTVYSLTDDAHIAADSLGLKPDTGRICTQAWVSFAQRDPTKKLDEESNYAASEVYADLSAQGDTKNRGQFVRRIYSRWITSTGAATALETAERIVTRFSRPMKSGSLTIAAKDNAISLGDFVEVTHRLIQDDIGNKQPTMFQVLERADADAGSTIRLTVQEAPSRSFVEDAETRIIITGYNVNVNLRTVYNQQVGGIPLSGDVVRFIIRSNAVIGGYSAGIYSTGIVSSEIVGDFERRGLYLGQSQTFNVQRSMAPNIVQFVRNSVALKYMPAIHVRGEIASVLRARGATLGVGNRAAPVTGTLMCDLRTIPTVPSLQTGTWPAGVVLILEVEPGARIPGEGGAGAYQHCQPNQPFDALVSANLTQIYASMLDRYVYGGDGGDAIKADHPITIINNGVISGGGGGGGGIVGAWQENVGFFVVYGNAGITLAGGGGQGYYGGEAVSDVLESPADLNNLGYRGGLTAAGQPSAKGVSLTRAGSTVLGFAGGGHGGTNGAAGNPGGLIYASDFTQASALFSSGGLAGRAVVNSHNVTWQTRGVIYGQEV